MGAFIEEQRSSFDGLFFRLKADELQNEKTWHSSTVNV